jgi:DNA-binding MarR family transcriptional regulator
MDVDGSADPELAELAESVHWSMFRIASAFRRREYARIPDDLTMTQCSILYALREGGRTRLTDLAAKEGVRAPTMTMAITRLESLGLVRRQRDEADGRVLWIEATSQGVDAQRAAVAQTVDGILTMLNEAELQALRAALQPLKRLATVEVEEAESKDRL